MISIIKKPFRYQPAGNPAIFQIESNNPDIVYFEVKVAEALTEAILINQRYFIRPNYVTGVSFNLSNVLTNLVQLKLNNTINLAAAVEDATLSYKLIITEKVNSSGSLINGSVYSDVNLYTVWDGSFDRQLFSLFNPDDYIVNSNKLAKFLSIKPTISNQSDNSLEHLHFLNGDNLATKVRIRTFDKSGNQLNLVAEELPEGLMIKLNVSPRNLTEVLGIDFSSVGYYKIDLLNLDDEIISETKQYNYLVESCNLEPVNFLFTTSLGGVESFTFYNPKQSINTTKTTLKSNVLQLNGGVYSDNIAGVLNQTDKIISSVSKSTYTVFSNPLTDSETIYLKELISSQNVYVENSLNDNLIPVTIKNNNYSVALRKTSGGKLNRLEIQYEM
ncbi:hypothetical protein [Pedobacter agri]|uniref:hypothetical protein n=1 Tax=Pedobacter agri TaxID=454586 RepID=UPI00292EE46E|nr:hypothetical protein [Pedobacter agri]